MVGTAWTEQGEGRVRSIEARAASAIEDAVRWAVRAPAPGAVKVGMVPGPDAAEAILRGLVDFRGPVVVDPVLMASSGGPLWEGPLDRLGPLLRRATLVTPNAPEAAALAGRPVRTLSDAAAVAAELCALGIAAVLVKGGHLEPGDEVVTDLLATAQGQRSYRRRRAPGPSPRGTGCALATAVAVGLASGLSLEVAVGEATTWLADRISRAGEQDGERRLG
jgi:hydroxymethylpyrimidine/phosphomethylpyrimidine kinase